MLQEVEKKKVTSSLLAIYKEFEAADDAAEKAAFEKAMEERINTDGYKVCDLMYQLYKCEKSIADLYSKLEALSPKA